MDESLQQQCFRAFFRLKKTGMNLPKVAGINTKEFLIMEQLSDCDSRDKCPKVAEIQQELFVSKAAVSQMYSSLEKKGYIVREIDRSNRRRITVKLTGLGKETVHIAETRMKNYTEAILQKFGEKKTEKLIVLLNQLVDAAEETGTASK